MRSVPLYFVLILLVALHDLDKHLAVNTSLRVSVGSHVAGVTPLDGFYESELQKLANLCYVA